MAGEIEATETKLHELEKEIAEIGEPAACTLRNRLEALKIEEHALQRNFSEAQPAGAGPPDKARMRKVIALLHHIEREELSIQHEADFLQQGALTTLEMAIRGAAHIIDPTTRTLKRVKGDHQWLWHSPFVNHTHDNLAEHYIMPQEDED